MVLLANGICFTIMSVIFVAFGSVADYGHFGRWILLFLTVVVSGKLPHEGYTDRYSVGFSNTG